MRDKIKLTKRLISISLVKGIMKIKDILKKQGKLYKDLPDNKTVGEYNEAIKSEIIRLVEKGDKDWSEVFRYSSDIATQWMADSLVEWLGKGGQLNLKKKIDDSDFEGEDPDFVVSKKLDKLTGILTYGIIPEKELAQILVVYVDPTHRGKGIATKLMDFFENYCKIKNIKTIEAIINKGAESATKSAIEFYKNKRFKLKEYIEKKKTYILSKKLI